MSRSIDGLITICMKANPEAGFTSQEVFEEHYGCFGLAQTCEVLETLDLVREGKRDWELTPRMHELLVDLGKAKPLKVSETSSIDDDPSLIKTIFMDAGWEGEEWYFDFVCNVLQALGLVAAVGDGSWRPTARLKRLAKHRVVDLKLWRMSHGPLMPGRWSNK